MKNNNWILPLGIALIVMLGFLGGLYIIGEVYKTSLYIVPSKNINLSFSFNDAFIGVIATLIGIMVTFAIGYQILNAIQINDKLKLHEEKLDSFINEIDEKSNLIDEKYGFRLLIIKLEKSRDSYFQNLNHTVEKNTFSKTYYALQYLNQFILFIDDSSKLHSIEIIKERTDYLLLHIKGLQFIILDIMKAFNDNEIISPFQDLEEEINKTLEIITYIEVKENNSIIKSIINCMIEALRYKKSIDMTKIKEIEKRYKCN